ncbi:adenylate kinase [PVC group bacterium]|nr:adenylate kinase [PVC group bacterium]
MRIALLGAPGSGKGTQALMLQKRLGLIHISTGDIFRASVKSQSALGEKAKTYMDQGELIPDSIVVELVIERLQKLDCQKGYILDGFPRTKTQAEALEDTEFGVEIVLCLDVPDEELVKRLTGRQTCLTCGHLYHVTSNPPKKPGVCDRCQGLLKIRNDDLPDVVKKRLEVYKRLTLPLVEFYRAKKKLIDINGHQEIDQIFHEILQELTREQLK